MKAPYDKLTNMLRNEGLYAGFIPGDKEENK